MARLYVADPRYLGGAGFKICTDFLMNNIIIYKLYTGNNYVTKEIISLTMLG